MAPVTDSISDAHKNRDVFLFSNFKRLVAPWVPVNRIMCVLQKIRTFFFNECICVFVLDHCLVPEVELSDLLLVKDLQIV